MCPDPEDYFVYAIQSQKDGRVYIGLSKNPVSRLSKSTVKSFVQEIFKFNSATTNCPQIVSYNEIRYGINVALQNYRSQ